MANAKKCNRCGKCFDPYHMDGDMCQFRNPMFQNSENLKEMKRAGLLYEDSGPDAWVDLCPTCAQGFVIFMNGGELEKRNGVKDFAKIIRERENANVNISVGLEKCKKQLCDCVNDAFSRILNFWYGEEDEDDG